VAGDEVRAGGGKSEAPAAEKEDKKETPPDVGESEESPLVDPGEPPDDTTEETAPEKLVETIAPGEPGTTDEPSAVASTGGGDPDAVYQRVYEEQKAKGSSEMVAVARAKAAQKKAQRGDS
jgi:hypothetical protein